MTQKTLMENSVPIHEGESPNEKVIKFISLEKFSTRFQEMYNNNQIYGVYMDEAGIVVAEDIWQDIHENILA